MLFKIYGLWFCIILYFNVSLHGVNVNMDSIYLRNTAYCCRCPLFYCY